MLLVSGMKLSQSVEVIEYCFFVNLFVDIIIGFLYFIINNYKHALILWFTLVAWNKNYREMLIYTKKIQEFVNSS